MAYIDADYYFDRKEAELEKLPKCSGCGEYIQTQDCIQLPDGDIYCSDCEHENASSWWHEFGREYFAIYTEDLMGRE